MGDSNFQAFTLKTAPPTSGVDSDQDEGGDEGETGVRPKGLCHVTFFKRQFSSLILPCEKQTLLPALFSMIFVSRGHP
jgi:hypothetical protein